MMVKFAALSLVLLAAIGGGTVIGRHMIEGGMELADQAYVPKHELRLMISDAQRGVFFATVEKFASQNGFELKHNQSGLPLKDGRAIVYLVFSRTDGVEIRIADVLQPGEMIIDFYDKLESGNWKVVSDDFTKSVASKFGLDHT